MKTKYKYCCFYIEWWNILLCVCVCVSHVLLLCLNLLLLCFSHIILSQADFSLHFYHFLPATTMCYALRTVREMNVYVHNVKKKVSFGIGLCIQCIYHLFDMIFDASDVIRWLLRTILNWAKKKHGTQQKFYWFSVQTVFAFFSSVCSFFSAQCNLSNKRLSSPKMWSKCYNFMPLNRYDNDEIYSTCWNERCHRYWMACRTN